jgi:Apea-like HEPN
LLAVINQNGMTFEIFCIDQKGKVKFKDKENFLDALSFNEGLWNSQPTKNYEECSICDSKKGLKIKIDTIDTKKVVADLFISAFILRIEGQFEDLEQHRIKLLIHLRDLGFNHIRILTDDVSTDLSLKIYPLINKIENLLRRYIVKFFITKIGLGWFDISVSKEIKDKIKIRKENEPHFTRSSLVDTDVTLIDFNELGEIITRQTSVYSKVEDVIDKINRCNSLEELKNEVTGHYPKYFKTIFGNQNFESKWKTLFEIRNKVAHNNYLVVRDFDESTRLVQELEIIISEAEDKIDEAVLTVTEKQAISKAIQEIVTEQQSVQTDSQSQESIDDSRLVLTDDDNIDTETLIHKHFSTQKLDEDLIVQELRYFKKINSTWRFIALTQFLDYLEIKGFNRHIASSLISIMNDQEKILIEYIDNPRGFFDTATIKEKI